MAQGKITLNFHGKSRGFLAISQGIPPSLLLRSYCFGQLLMSYFAGRTLLVTCPNISIYIYSYSYTYIYIYSYSYIYIYVYIQKSQWKNGWQSWKMSFLNSCIISNCLRFLMPPVPKELFLEMCYEAVRANPRCHWWSFKVKMTILEGKVLWGANADWVTPEGKGALYLRPLLMGSGAALGVGGGPSWRGLIWTIRKEMISMGWLGGTPRM